MPPEYRLVEIEPSQSKWLPTVTISRRECLSCLRRRSIAAALAFFIIGSLSGNAPEACRWVRQRTDFVAESNDRSVRAALIGARPAPPHASRTAAPSIAEELTR
jgi:hypothetical protein